jgi:23S rRNA (cytidine1920-2'-O)/16S rRNA (cytidine1409-2'-O)-methyltransferase
MRSEDFQYSPDLAVMDVSFISATYIIPAVFDVLTDGGEFICLIKPQFEVGRSGVGKGGIVKDSKTRDSAVKKVADFARDVGFEVKEIIQSPIKGGDGNIEFLAHFVK